MAEEAEHEDALDPCPSPSSSAAAFFSSSSERPAAFAIRTTPRAIRSDRIIAKVESTARNTKAKEVALLMSGEMCSAATPSVRRTSENSLSWLRLRGRQHARPDALPQPVERREGGGEPAHHREGRDHEREPQHLERRDRDRHAEADEEQGDEEIPEARHLGLTSSA